MIDLTTLSVEELVEIAFETATYARKHPEQVIGRRAIEEARRILTKKTGTFVDKLRTRTPHPRDKET